MGNYEEEDDYFFEDENLNDYEVEKLLKQSRKEDRKANKKKKKDRED
jgi:hypothetical protein